jgi:Xaa-Pro aminopeptidase
MNHARRIRQLRRQMAEQELQAVFVRHLPDVRYLCGFTGSNAALVITAQDAVLFTDGRYTTQAKEEVRSAKPVIAPKSAQAEAVTWLTAQGIEQAAFDAAHTTVAELERFRAGLPARQRKNFFQPLPTPLVEQLRLVKDADEIEIMTEAAQFGCRLFDHLLSKIQSGLPEIAVAAELEYAARCQGAEGMSFETIVASGARSALPHGRATEARISRNGFIVLDFGVILKGYCSDMTRTVHVGRASTHERAIYDAVLEAQTAAVAAVRAGVTCGEVDEAARSVLRRAGLAENFTHSTGHGVGIEIHEAPRVAAGQDTKLKSGMVITIEPGVYLEGQFGIRIEDMVLVTRNGAEILTPATKALIEL